MAMAQTALEEIIVTAQGRTQSLADVPVAVSVVSGEMLESFSMTGVEDVAQRLPNVEVRSGPADGLFIRGVGSGNNPGFQQSVGVYVDGVYRSRSRSIHSALFDIDRVDEGAADHVFRRQLHRRGVEYYYPQAWQGF